MLASASWHADVDFQDEQNKIFVGRTGDMCGRIASMKRQKFPTQTGHTC